MRSDSSVNENIDFLADAIISALLDEEGEQDTEAVEQNKARFIEEQKEALEAAKRKANGGLPTVKAGMDIDLEDFSGGQGQPNQPKGGGWQSAKAQPKPT